MTFSTIPDTSSGNNMDLHRGASRDGAVPPLAPQPCPRPSHAASGDKTKARAILAAIHALLGNKGKAMELLRRHFYQFERYNDVRAMEMWEARVDYVFASIKDDPEFIKLTALAR